MSQGIPQFFFDSLRIDPIPATVPGSLPVLCFGDPSTAVVATVGINPSNREYLSPKGLELDGPLRRFETLGSLRASSRRSLNDAQATKAIERMYQYFGPTRPIYSWFNGLCRVVDGMQTSFRDRTAVHLDLVQEATKPAWSELVKTDRAQAEAVLHRDLSFLQGQINECNFRAVVCTSASVWDEVDKMLSVRVVARGNVALIKWTVGTAVLSRGVIGVVGWNIPLARATGLNKDGQRQLGELLASQLKLAGINLP